MGEREYKELVEIVSKEVKGTSSLFDLQEGSLSFIKNVKFSGWLKETAKNVHVLVPSHIPKEAINEWPGNVHVHLVDDHVEYVFACIHNKIHENTKPRENVIGRNCRIHETALVGIDGKKYVECPDGSKMLLKEIGNVVLEDNVDIDAYSLVRRAVLTSTVIGRGVKICAKVNIGHNCCIGENTLISPGVLVGGSSMIGKNCYIWQGAMIRSHATICDNVIIGMGSVVTEDIKEPGVYVGSPAKYLKPYDKKLR